MAIVDGLDALIEYYIPLAKDYPIAPLIYLFVFALPVALFVWVLRGFRGFKEKDKPK